MSDIRFEGWLHRTGTGGVYQDSAGNVGIASTQPKTRLDIQNGAFQIGPAGICTATTVNTTNLVNATQLSHRNLIINGAMIVAQRGTSNSGSESSGYGTVDRFRVQYSGVDEAPTQAQVDVASGTDPYTLGFKKAHKITNGNQTSGAGSSDYIYYEYYAEAQDIGNSGWNYTSSSSFVTLQFWIKSSVAQNFYGSVRTRQGTSKIYPFETGSLSANTWTKITKTIPGHSDLQFDNATAKHFQLNIMAFLGTDSTDSGVSLNTWATYATGTRTPDQTSTWYTTNDATLEITGVQVEVGSVATPFEHLSYGDELRRCQRYYYRIEHDDAYTDVTIGTAHQNGAYGVVTCQNPVVMRTKPSITVPTVTDAYSFYYAGTVNRSNTISLSGNATKDRIELSHTNFSATDGVAGLMRITNATAYIEVTSEL